MRIVAAVLFLLVVGIYFWRRKRAVYVFGLARDMEENGHYEAACFHYAVAANTGHKRAACRGKIKDLWNAYGPFEFRDQLGELEAEYCRDPGCGEGLFRVTVEDIHKLVDAGENRSAGS